MASMRKEYGWPDSEPDRLDVICLRYIANNLEVISQQSNRCLNAKPWNRLPHAIDCRGDCPNSQLGEISKFGCYQLHPGIILPRCICNPLLLAMETRFDYSAFEMLSIFSDSDATCLSHADLRSVDEDLLAPTLEALSEQPLEDLVLPCVWLILPFVEYFSHTLLQLRLEGDFRSSTPVALTESMYLRHDTQYRLECPRLTHLHLHGLKFVDSPGLDQAVFNSHIVDCMIGSLSHLTHLSLCLCPISLEVLHGLSHLTTLLSLNLSDVSVKNFATLFYIIAPLKKLRHLDLSQSGQGLDNDGPVMYVGCEWVLELLMKTFVELVSLDIAGTNLAGFEISEPTNHRLTVDQRMTPERNSIHGLHGRHLDYLGLYGCAYNACGRKNIHARKVTGTESEGQILTALTAYIGNRFILISVLSDLFGFLCHNNLKDHRSALEGVLAAMSTYPNDNNIQVTSSACLLYIAKGQHKPYITHRHRRKIVELLLCAIQRFSHDQRMVKGACLTLCQLNLPGDVMFCYGQMVKLLLDLLNKYSQNEFIQHIGIFIINSLSCQVDGNEKELLGDIGVVETILGIISDKADNSTYSDILEVAWSFLWNITDETSSNSERFLDDNGMFLFTLCFKKFRDVNELLRNMMGLVGNVAEVGHLRHRLMRQEYVDIFSKLLLTNNEDIEIRYNVCGVFSHLLSDGSDAWILSTPDRSAVCHLMTAAIKSWPLSTKRNIHYKSFRPILHLVRLTDCPAAKHWACWALCNLTTVLPDKYCHLLALENGRDALTDVVNSGEASPEVKMLAMVTMQAMSRMTPARRVPGLSVLFSPLIYVVVMELSEEVAIGQLGVGVLLLGKLRLRFPFFFPSGNHQGNNADKVCRRHVLLMVVFNFICVLSCGAYSNLVNDYLVIAPNELGLMFFAIQFSIFCIYPSQRQKSKNRS